MCFRIQASRETRPWLFSLFEPAIKLASQGFEMNPRLNGMLESARNRSAHSAQARSIFFDAEGQPLPVGAD